MKILLEKNHLASFIAGKIVTHQTKTSHSSVVDHKQLAKLSLCRAKDIKQAIDSTLRAQSQLDSLSSYQRADILFMAAEQLIKYKNEIAKLITHEVGKPIKESRSEVEYAASYFHWFSEEAKRVLSISYPSKSETSFLLRSYKRVGPCFFITPWNFPLALPARKIAAAIAAGCASLLKPCTEAPLTSLCLGILLQKASLPDGALNILIGDPKQISTPILKHPAIRKVSFTGSKEVGKTLYLQSANTLKRLTLELGGNAPFLVFNDADLEKATDAALTAKFRNGGQTCIAANRFLIQKDIFEDFIELFSKKASKLKVGNPLNSTTDLSTILHPSSLKKIKKNKADAIKKGACAHLKNEELFEAEIFSKIKQNMLIYQEENFGPIAPCMSFKDDGEAFCLANSTSYGLASYVFTRSLKRAHQIRSNLEFGMIGLNTGSISMAESSFGGIKQSGFGREGGFSGLFEYLTETMIVEKL